MQEFMELFDQLSPENQEAMLDVLRVMNNPRMTICFPGDGTAVIRWPSDYFPDTATIERASKLLNEYAAQMR